MDIRSTAKAIIIRDNKILLNICKDDKNSEYYSLPGGGQNQYETLNDAVIRECLEETGYRVIPIRFAALCEEICLDKWLRQNYPHYAHKIYHIFICRLCSKERQTPTEQDIMQVGVKWVDIQRVNSIRLLPSIVGQNITKIITSDVPTFLGSEIIEFNHG